MKAIENKLELAEKAWCINTYSIEEGYYLDEEIAYSNNRNKAKMELLNEACDYKTTNGKYISYLNLKYREQNIKIDIILKEYKVYSGNKRN